MSIEGTVRYNGMPASGPAYSFPTSDHADRPALNVNYVAVKHDRRYPETTVLVIDQGSPGFSVVNFQ